MQGASIHPSIHPFLQVLAEMKAEFGYDMNPEDVSMKNRIEEREKVLLKEEREIKKKKRNKKLLD